MPVQLGRAQGETSSSTRWRVSIMKVAAMQPTSAKMEKTIVVEVQRLVQHPKYRRVVRISKKFYAHDEKRVAKQGDTVCIVSTRPLSRLKRWRLKEVLTQTASAKK